MSTTFEVYPKTATISSFQNILDLSIIKLREFLKDFGLSYNLEIKVRLYSEETYQAQPLDLQAAAKWDESNYAWFYIPQIPGGTDVYFRELSHWQQEIWDEIINENRRATEKKDLIQACLKNGYYWVFRRSAGQPAIINLSYGLIAASLAELTEGFIYSEDDNACDYERFPATASEFFFWYFRPELAVEPDKKVWATECIKDLPQEIQKEYGKQKSSFFIKAVVILQLLVQHL